MNIEKPFDSQVDSICYIRESGFGKSFIDWIKILLCNQKSCLLNSVFTTKYFNLEKGTCQEDTICGYLFIFALEINFLLTKIILQKKVLKFSTMFFFIRHMPVIQRFSSKI